MTAVVEIIRPRFQSFGSLLLSCLVWRSWGRNQSQDRDRLYTLLSGPFVAPNLRI